VSGLVYYHRDDESEAFNRAVRDQMRREGYDDRIRRAERARRDAALTKRTRIHLLAWIIVLAAAALVIIGWDHERGPLNLPRPVETTDVTATVPPHPATTGSHP
jgi:hypothetical protein